MDALLRRLYGRSSEKIDLTQLGLFEAEAPAATPAEEPEPEPPSPERKGRTGRGRRALPKHLPRRRVVYEIPEADRICPCCGVPMSPIREETSEQLDYEPASAFVVDHVRLVDRAEVRSELA